MKKRILIILIILLAVFILAHTVSAVGLLPITKGTTATSPGGAIAEMIGWVITAVLGVVGAIALVLFVYGGLMMIISGGSSEKINKGKEILIWATIGLLVILGSYMLVSFVIFAVKGK